MVGVAVKVTACPAQIGLPGFAAMLTDGVNVVVTCTVYVAIAVVGDAHDAFDVTLTETISLLFKVDELKLTEFVPAFVPLTCH